MKLKTCKHCGTEYDKAAKECPRCGKSNKKGKKPKVPMEDRIPRWMWIVSIVVLVVAILIGVVAYVINMGFLTGEFKILGPSIVPEGEVAETSEDIVYGTGETPQDPEGEDKPVEGACMGLTISSEELIFEEAQAYEFLTAVPQPIDCTDEVTYRSLDETVAIVEDGRVIAVGPGETEIVVTCGEIEKRCKVVCAFEVDESEELDETEDPNETEEPDETEETEEPAPAPEVAPADFTMFRTGEKVTLTLKNVPEGATVTYTSTNPAVATVTADGVVEAHMENYGSLYGTSDIIIMVGDVKLVSIARCDFRAATEE